MISLELTDVSAEDLIKLHKLFPHMDVTLEEEEDEDDDEEEDEDDEDEDDIEHFPALPDIQYSIWLYTNAMSQNVATKPITIMCSNVTVQPLSEGLSILCVLNSLGQVVWSVPYGLVHKIEGKEQPILKNG